jgi:uncharacterized damage-inducible protein DinB
MSAFDFLVDTYETERLKTLSVWSQLRDDDLAWRPAPLLRTPREHMVHQCASEHAWMSGMLGIESGAAALPEHETRLAFLRHYALVSERRLARLRERPQDWFPALTAFFGEQRSRSWVLVRRFTHSAHHRAQLTVYLRLLGRPLYSIYGPTADTGGLFQNGARVIYRYADAAELLAAEERGGHGPALPGPGAASPTERPEGR